MDFQYTYEMGEAVGAAVGAAYLLYFLLSIVLGILTYVLTSWGVHTIAKRRGIANPWIAWIPVVGVWTLGSISDQYRYVTKGQVKSKRIILLVLQIILTVLSIVSGVISSVGTRDLMSVMFSGTDSEIMTVAMTMVMRLMGMVLLILCVNLAFAILRYMALYDLYTSVNPAYSVVFTVLSIIPIVSVCEPFFIFCNRNKDLGMPPRCDIPVDPIYTEPQYLPPQPVQEPWENNPEA